MHENPHTCEHAQAGIYMAHGKEEEKIDGLGIIKINI